MGRKKDKSNLYDKMMDEISQFLFRKPYYSLQLSEIKIISDYFNDLSNQVYKPIIINSIDTEWLVSNIGTIKDQNGVIIKPSQSGNGYLNVYINEKFGVLGVHRLVAEAFIPNPENKPQVNHLNGVKYCNWWRNLEWNTAKENARHAWDNGLTNNYGENQGSSKYTNKEIEYVCKLLSEGLTHDEINKITNVDKNIIYNIHNNLTWKFISKNYDIPPYKAPEKKYSTDTIHKTCKLLENPEYSHQYISEKTGVSINAIKDIMKKTSYKNISDMYNIKPRINKGEFSPISKYTSDQIHSVCKMLESGNIPMKEISNKTGVGLSIVYDIKRGTKWKSISSNYKF